MGYVSFPDKPHDIESDPGDPKCHCGTASSQQQRYNVAMKLATYSNPSPDTLTTIEKLMGM